MGIELSLRAVQNHQLSDVSAGLIHIINGRHFFEEEMNQINDTIPIIIADPFAEVNHLTTGSTFEAENIIWSVLKSESMLTDSGFYYEEDRNNGPFASESYLFEVVGIFEITHSLSDSIAPMEEEELKNRIYIPMVVAEQMETFRKENDYLAWYEATGENFLNLEEGMTWRDNLFVLNDWTEFESFKDEAEQIIPSGFHVADFSFLYEDILVAMDNIQFINHFLLWVGIGGA